MSAPAQNLSLGEKVGFTIDPTIAQNVQQSAQQITAKQEAQVALGKATSSGGSARRRRRRSYKGGVGGVGAETIRGDPTTIVVAPLPLGANTANAQANNVAAASLFANAVSASKYDSAVIPPKVGGKRGRRTRRLSKKRTSRRSRSTSSKKHRKMMKVKKSRRTRRR
jgi:hypothetical protein